VELWLHSLLTSKLAAGGWSSLRPGLFTQRQEPPLPIEYEAGWSILQLSFCTDTHARLRVILMAFQGAVVAANQGCGVGVGVVESESEGILGGVGVGKNVPTPTRTSI
jgi:hypothetical protein